MPLSIRRLHALRLAVFFLLALVCVGGNAWAEVTPPVMRAGRQQSDPVVEKYGPHDTFFCHFVIRGLKSGTLTVIWYRDQEVLSKASAKLGQRIDWMSSPEPPTGGWKPGKYHVDILVDNKVVRRAWVTVEEKPTAFEHPPQATMPQSVGRVNSVSPSGTVAVKRPGIKSWRRAYNFMPLYVGDQVATDARSQAVVELNLGGTLGMDHRTAIHIIGSKPRVADVEGPQALQNVKIMHGSVWSKFKKQHEPFYFTTSRSKVKITGTELDCSVGEEDGPEPAPVGPKPATPEGVVAAPVESVSLLEGHISYEPIDAPQQTSPTEPARTEVKMEPGQKMTNDAGRVPRVKSYKSEELRKTLDVKHPGLGNAVVKGALNYGIALGMHALMQQPGFGRLLSNPWIKEGIAVLFGKKDEGVPTGLEPNGIEANPNALTFSWQDTFKREKFLVMVSVDESFKTIDWSGSTDTTSLTFPMDAMPLVPGQKYYWMVVGASAKGKFKGKAAQSYFTVPVSYEPPPTTPIANDVGAEDGASKPAVISPDESGTTTVAPTTAAPVAPKKKRDLTKVRVDETTPVIAKVDTSTTGPTGPPKKNPQVMPQTVKTPATVKVSGTTPPAVKKQPPQKTVASVPGGGPAFFVQQRDAVKPGTALVILSGFAWDPHGVKSVTIGGQEAVVSPLQSFDLAAYRKKPNCVKFTMSVTIKPGQEEVPVAVTNVDGKSYEKSLPLQSAVASRPSSEQPATTPTPAPSPASSPAPVSKHSVATANPSPSPVSKQSVATAKGGGGRRFALLIGVCQFDDPQINALKYPPNDVKELQAALVDPAHGGYAPENVKVLDGKSGDKPTLANIGKAFNWLSQHANQPDDLVFIYFSSHGYSDPTSGTSYIICADTPVASIGTVGFPVADFNDTLKNLPARQKFIVLDTCHSGGIGRNDKGADSLSDGQRDRLLGSDSRVEGDIRALSCDRGQVSWESDDIKHGVFTYFLIKGLQGAADANHDGVVTTDEMNTYLQMGFIQWSKSHAGFKQTPVFDGMGSGIMVISGKQK